VTPAWYSEATAEVYSNRLNVVKDGTGTAVLTQANTYTGSTRVDGGVLQVGKGGTGTRSQAVTMGVTGTGGIQVNSGGVLAGTGVVQTRSGVVHEINNGGTMAPGDLGGAALGTLFVDGDLRLNSGGTIELQITAATLNMGGLADWQDTTTYNTAMAGLPANAQLANPISLSQHDHLEISGNMDLSGGGLGAGSISILDAGYLAGAAAGDVFNLIDWASVTNTGFGAGTNYSTGGGLGDLVLPMLTGGLVWDTSLFANHGILVVTAPEPGRAILLLGGLMAWALRRRRLR
jgi:autotransporter-associated beta strand protein